MPERSPQRSLTSREIRWGMGVSIAEGALAIIWTSLIGGTFQTGFLLLLGATSAQIGLMAALPPLSNLAQVSAAFVLSRLPRRKPFMVSLAFVHRVAVSAVGFLPLVVAKGAWVWTALAVYFVGNLALAFASPAWSSMMADMVPAESRGRYFGLRNAVGQVVAVLTLLIGGKMLDRHAGYAGFYGLYVVAVGLGMADVAAFMAQPEPPYVRAESRSALAHLGLPFGVPAFRSIMLVFAAATTAGALVQPFYAVHMLKEMHLSYSLIAALTTASTVAGIVSYLGLGRLLDRIGELRALDLLLPLSMVVPLLWLLLRSGEGWLLFPVYVLSGALGASIALTFNTLSIRLSPRANRPIYLATFAACAGLGGFVAPMVGGNVMEHLGFPVLLSLAVAAFGLLTALWWLRLRRHLLLAAWEEER